MALDRELSPDIWPACSSCGTHTSPEWYCSYCRGLVDENGDLICWSAQEWWEKPICENVWNHLDDFSVGWSLWIYNLNGKDYSIMILNIQGKQWRFKEFILEFWCDIVSIETNGSVVKNYKTKVRNKKRWGTRWKRKNPPEAIKQFLEEKLWAKFALS